MKAATKLKKHIAKLAKRSDLNIAWMNIGSPVPKAELARFEGVLPSSLIAFYRVMDGCDFFADLVNDRSLAVGIRIPKLAHVGEFVQTPVPEYQFRNGELVLSFEWIEPLSTSFFVRVRGSADVDDARIVSAPAGEEHAGGEVAASLGEFIERALEHHLCPSWMFASEDATIRQRVENTGAALSAPPAKRKILLPGTRVSKDQEERGTVVKQLKTARPHEHYGDDFCLVAFDSRRSFWVQSAAIRKLPKAMDEYETAKQDAAAFLASLDAMTALEGARVVCGAVGLSQHWLGVGPVAVPMVSKRLFGLFRHSSSDKGDLIATLIGICQRWTPPEVDLQEAHALPAPARPYNKKDPCWARGSFCLADVVSVLWGCAVLLAADHVERGEPFPAEAWAHFEAFRETLNRDHPQLKRRIGTSLAKSVELLPEFYQSQTLEHGLFFEDKYRDRDRDDWLDEVGLAPPHGFWL